MILRLCFILFVGFFISSCIGIPTGSSVDSVQKIGERYDGNGSMVSFIERRKIKNKWFFILSSEGSGTIPLFSEKFYIYKEGRYYEIKHIDRSFEEENFLSNIIPLNSSNQWIAFKLKKIVSRYEADIDIIVFNESDIIYNTTIQGCIRSPNCEENHSTPYYSLQAFSIYQIDNFNFLIKTKEGNYNFNAIDKKLTKKGKR